MQIRINGKTIGELKGNKLVKAGKQAVLLYSLDGFGIPETLLDGGHDIKTIEVHHKEETYTASVDNFRENGIKYHRPPYEPQLILPRKFWSRQTDKQLKLV